MADLKTKAGSKLRSILTDRPFHLMYEEEKNVPEVENLNPLLRRELSGSAIKYPNLSRATCDVVFDLDGERVWMEVKLIQPHNGGNKESWRFEDRNRNFEKHLGLKEDPKHHSALRDVRDRLPSLDGCPLAHRIGFLMIAYHSPRFPLDDSIAAFERLGKLHAWAKGVLIDIDDPRPRAKVEHASITVHYWERATKRG